MIRNIYKATLLMMAVCALASCINDESDYGNEGSIPSLKVSGDDQTAMPVYNFNLGETVVINPEINYSGNAADLTYHWQVGTYTNSVKGKLEDAGNERSLTYSFEQGGTCYAHLNVTDGRVGKAVDYQINVNRTFEQGYVLVSNDAQGNGNLAFVSIPTKEGEKPILMEHCLERMNDGMTMRNLLGMEVYTITWPSTITRVFVLGQDKGYCIDANTFSVLTEIDYSEIYPGFKATQESNDASAPYVYDAAQKKTIHVNVQYMFPYENTNYIGQAYDEFQATQYLRWERLYANQLYVDYHAPLVAIYYAYAPYFGYPSPFVSTGEMLSGQKLLAAFNATEYGETCCPLYVLTQTADGKTARLYENTQNTFPEEQYFNMQELTLSGDEALPQQGTRFMASPTYKRYFYPIGNRLYAFLTEGTFAYPKTSQYVYDFGQGETITAMNIDITTERLFVATQTTSTGRGNFYIFNCADLRTDNQGNVKPIETYKDCADKIVSIVNKPRVQ